VISMLKQSWILKILVCTPHNHWGIFKNEFLLQHPL
jgi:hypothetical protein